MKLTICLLLLLGLSGCATMGAVLSGAGGGLVASRQRYVTCTSYNNYGVISTYCH